MELGKLFTKSIMAFLLFFLMFNQTRANEFLVTPPPCEERDTVDVVICSFSSYTFYGTTYNMPGTYYDTVIGGACDTIHTLILDTTAGTDPTIVISASGNVVCYNDSVIISSTVQFPGSSPTYNWKKNGSAFGTNSPTLTVYYAALNNGDVFFVK